MRKEHDFSKSIKNPYAETFETQEGSVFSPMYVGNLEIANRLMMAPMGLNVVPRTGDITEDAEHYFLERARGGVGLIMLSSSGWARMDGAHPSVPFGQVSLYQEKHCDGYRRLLASLKHTGVRTGVKVGIQLSHRGRQATTKDFGYPPVAPSAAPWSPRAEVPQALTTDEINRLVERFGKAAAIAKAVGFDLVEVHASHGYLINNFLSPDSNRREDAYGGDLQGRAKFLLDIIKSIRSEVGACFPVSVRINGSDNTKTGLTIEDSKRIAHLLESAGTDLISVSGGVNGSFPLTIAPYYHEKACYTPFSEEIRRNRPFSPSKL